MPITVQCSCGKRMGVSDSAGGQNHQMPRLRRSPPGHRRRTVAGRQNACQKADRKPRDLRLQRKDHCPGVALNRSGLGLMFYFGPVRVWNQWEDIGPKASDDISNVITFGLQAYLSQQGEYDPMNAHGAPAVDGTVSFFRPTLVMSMPEKVKFFGKSSQGNFVGFYHPATGEIEADVAYGGMTFAGAVDLAKATNQFHMTGRMANGFPQAEVNGTPIKILWPDKKDQ